MPHLQREVRGDAPAPQPLLSSHIMVGQVLSTAAGPAPGPSGSPGAAGARFSRGIAALPGSGGPSGGAYSQAYTSQPLGAVVAVSPLLAPATSGVAAWTSPSQTLSSTAVTAASPLLQASPAAAAAASSTQLSASPSAAALGVGGAPGASMEPGAGPVGSRASGTWAAGAPSTSVVVGAQKGLGMGDRKSSSLLPSMAARAPMPSQPLGGTGPLKYPPFVYMYQPLSKPLPAASNPVLRAAAKVGALPSAAHAIAHHGSHSHAAAGSAAAAGRAHHQHHQGSGAAAHGASGHASHISKHGPSAAAAVATSLAPMLEALASSSRMAYQASSQTHAGAVLSALIPNTPPTIDPGQGLSGHMAVLRGEASSHNRSPWTSLFQTPAEGTSLRGGSTTPASSLGHLNTSVPTTPALRAGSGKASHHTVTISSSATPADLTPPATAPVSAAHPAVAAGTSTGQGRMHPLVQLDAAGNPVWPSTGTLVRHALAVPPSREVAAMQQAAMVRLSEELHQLVDGIRSDMHVPVPPEALVLKVSCLALLPCWLHSLGRWSSFPPWWRSCQPFLSCTALLH